MNNLSSEMVGKWIARMIGASALAYYVAMWGGIALGESAMLLLQPGHLLIWASFGVGTTLMGLFSERIVIANWAVGLAVTLIALAPNLMLGEPFGIIAARHLLFNALFFGVNAWLALRVMKSAERNALRAA